MMVRADRRASTAPWPSHSMVIRRARSRTKRDLDGNSQNNATENLKWGTRHENADDVVRHGSQQTHK